MNRVKNMGIDHRLYSRELRNLEIKIAERDRHIVELKQRLRRAEEFAEDQRLLLENERLLIRTGLFRDGAQGFDFTIEGRVKQRWSSVNDPVRAADVTKQLHLAAVAYQKAISDAANAVNSLCPIIEQEIKVTGLEQILSDE